MNKYTEILKIFIEQNPILVKEMKETNHEYSEGKLNPYHYESTVWTHTMMVISHMVRDNVDIDLFVAGLLHDIGKPKAVMIVEEKEKKVFYNHANISANMSLNIMKEIDQEFNNRFGKHLNLDIITIWQIINTHDIYVNHPKIDGKLNLKLLFKKFCPLGFNTLDMSLKLAKYDCYGRFCDDFESMILIDQLYNIWNAESLKLFNDIESEYIKKYNEKKDGPHCLFLVGLPLSGKSTSLLYNRNDVVISFDDEIMRLSNGRTYNEIWNEPNIKEQAEKNMNHRLMNAIKEKKNIVIDKTNLSAKSRRFVINQLTSDYLIKANVFLTSFEDITERNVFRNAEMGKFIPIGVIESMIKNFACPMGDEMDEIYFYYN